ncbi:MAG TPA: SRPBCC family protein [Chryseolinea sp.]|nr:SRPBCC family protein [Chryseolinea sp.]HPM31785.1 SRPBCC family protein [Chryseolinea sp.]
MTTINLTTEIKATIERCFDLSRDVDAHKLSAKDTNEKAVSGRTSGLCELGDTVTWEAKHFGVIQNLTIEITQFNRPSFFEDKMVKGAFKSMRHQHHFEERNGSTMMTDKFQYDVPFGLVGQLFDKLILKKYMMRFLVKRNRVLKAIAEN